MPFTMARRLGGAPARTAVFVKAKMAGPLGTGEQGHGPLAGHAHLREGRGDGELRGETARLMHMSPPAVTRAVAALEETIGARLFVRTTRSVKLTEAGGRYYEDCRRILADIVEAEAAAAGSYATPSGTLAVTASVLFGHMHVLPIMTDYLDAYPTMAARTLFVDRQVNIVEEGIDVAVRNRPPLGFWLYSRAGLGRCAASSAARRPTLSGTASPQTLQDLRDHRVAMSTGAWASTEWRFAQDQRVTVHPALMSNTNEAGIAAALAGWGLTRVLHYQIGSALLEGRLQVVLADYEEEPLPIHVVYPEGRQAPAKVRTFVDLAVARLRANRLLN